MKRHSELLALLVTINTLCVFAKADLAEALDLIGSIKERHMTVADFSSHGLDSDDAIFALEALRNDETITKLDLSNNFISFVSQSGTLQTTEENPNRTLKTLILANNILDTNRFGRILQIMSEFEALEEIDLQGTLISERRMRDISNAAKKLINQNWTVENDKLLKLKPGEADIPQIEETSLSSRTESSDEDDNPNWKHKKQGKKQKWREKKTLAEPFSEEEQTESDSSSVEGEY